MNETMQALQQYGGWATTFFIALYYLKFYNDFKKTVNEKDNLIKQMNQAHHEEMVAVVRECTGVLTAVNNSMGRWEAVMDRRS